MADTKSLLRYFWNDLINIRLIKIKFVWFTLLFGIVVIWPFLTLHMTSLGLSERDVGIVSALTAVITIVSPFIFGFIADKIGNFKFLVTGLTFVTGVVCLLFAAIPSTASSTSITASNSTNNVTTASSTGINGSNSTNNVTTASSTSVNGSNSTNNIQLLQQDNDNYATTFWFYLIVRGMFGLSLGGSYMLFDGAVMSHMQEHNLDYGMQRAWGTLAAGISPFVGGLLKDVYGMQVLWCVSATFYFITAAALLFFDLEFKKPTKSLCKEIFTQFINPEIIMLLLTTIAVGAISGYIETYMYIFLFGIGASNTLLGLTVTVAVPFEIIMQICATAIVGKIGHVNSLLIATFSYAIRTLGMSFLTNPWWVLLLEISDAISSGLFTTITMMYCTNLVTLTSIASFRGFLSVARSGIGKLLGTSIGTIIRENLGDRITYRILSGFALATTVIYLIAYQILKKYRSHQFSIQPTLKVTSQKTTTDKEIEMGIDNPAWTDNEHNNN